LKTSHFLFSSPCSGFFRSGKTGPNSSASTGRISQKWRKDVIWPRTPCQTLKLALKRRITLFKSGGLSAHIQHAAMRYSV